MGREIQTVGEFSLVRLSEETHVWLTRSYLENDHPVLDTIQIPCDRVEQVIAVLEAVAEAQREAKLHAARLPF